MKIRPTTLDDLPALQKVLEATGLFPTEMLPDMIHSFLGDEPGDELWTTCEDAGQATGFCYAAPEPLADGTWNMLAIAVDPSRQGTGHGKALVRHLEDALRKRGQRILIADTSGLEEYEGTRAFYRGGGYCEEARIRDFWADGDDKVTFWKAL